MSKNGKKSIEKSFEADFEPFDSSMNEFKEIEREGSGVGLCFPISVGGVKKKVIRGGSQPWQREIFVFTRKTTDPFKTKRK